ncbi:MAG: M1 family metallopeptidase [Phenylobacterium sp.]|uniref:M1 family metallopeptidase n=1 Tax=Phenylobacterium sp. TaxID=1871053 RepID=UPI001A465107|nr:M1 family metallopeptidase [Phenylobacterium sp.]MBL8556040.1 M1 family metallopeptidase [Phenylobacterium sp.]
MKFLAAFAAAFLAASSPVWAAHAAPPTAAKRVVLPTDVRPDRYEIHVVPDAARLTFDGHVKIALTVVRPTDRIVLNAADLTLGKARLSGAEAAPRVVWNEQEQTAAFVFPKTLTPGRYTLDIDYTGRIFQQPAGLFYLDYTAPDGSKRRGLYTQFENSDARRFAPMWDEPGVRSVFSLSVETPAGQMAVSNMPVAEDTTNATGRRTVRFADSPKMSSYLLFLALGDFERVSTMAGPVDVGVVVRKGDTAKAQFALDATVKLLGYYNDWFGTPYPLPKLDLIAGPGRSQFFSAMENWGAIFYFDYAILIDPRLSTESDRQQVFVTIAHEVAHQWFGDLVTMSWWDDLWLNESFASWMENKATDHFHPEWNIWLSTQGGQQRAMRLDSRAGTHPVITDIPDVFAAAGAFDDITYQKGQAMVRMLETYIGEDAFRDGVRAYIRQHAYGNTVSNDLWAALDKVAPGKNVSQVARDFLTRPGVPLIRAKAGAGGTTLTQDRVAADPTQRTPQTWRTPVRAAGLAGETWQGVVSAAKPQVAPLTGAVVVNAGQTGYFRTLYAPELWAKLAPRFATLAPADQLGLLYDSRALGEAGYAPMSDFLALARNAPAGADPVVLDTLAMQLAALDDLYEGRPTQDAYRAFARARLAPAAARFGWDPKAGEPDNAAIARRTLLGVLGDMRDPAVIAEARTRFQRWLADPASLEGAGRRTVLAIAAANADEATWEALKRQALASKDITDRSRLLSYLALSDDPKLIDKALALALSGEISPTDAPTIIAAVAGGHPDRAYDFAIAHRAQVDEFLEPASRTSYYAGLAAGSRDPAMLQKLAKLKATVPASARGEVEKAAGSIRYRLDVIAKRLPEADRWLAAGGR